jgi:PPOX class probable F420-dependent enzyme
MPAAAEPWQLELLLESRRATLATIAPDGRPRLVPCCYALRSVASASVDVLWIPLDEKPKRLDDPHDLARVRDIRRDARVSVLVDRWSEDWGRLAWVRLEGVAALVEVAGEGGDADRAAILRALRDRYPQYRDHALEGRPLIRIDIERISGWRARG